MKKLFLVALVVIMLPAVAHAQYEIRQADPGFIWEFWDAGITVELVVGESWCDLLYARNYGSPGRDIEGSPCTDVHDTFAVITSDLQGWEITNVFAGYLDDSWMGVNAEGTCIVMDDTCDWETTCDPLWAFQWDVFVVEVCITVPCDQGDLTGQLNTLTARMVYCDDLMVARPDVDDCKDPNYKSGDPDPIACYSTLGQDFEVIQPPPELQIFQDSLYYVEEGVTTAYIPFSLCNADLCASVATYDYHITSLGTVGPALDQHGTITGVDCGDCGDVYGEVDASLAHDGDTDELTIVAWNASTGLNYDTCVQVIDVISPVAVPLFTAPVVTILVLAMILAAAVIMKRHAVSKA